MKNIQAFVGHSFTSDDEQVVGKFLKYLDAIKEVSLDFSWEHAEKPEPSGIDDRSEEHTSELQSLMRISYAVFCLKNKKLLKYKITIDATNTIHSISKTK